MFDPGVTPVKANPCCAVASVMLLLNFVNTQEYAGGVSALLNISVNELPKSAVAKGSYLPSAKVPVPIASSN